MLNITKQVLDGQNPLILFEKSYAMHAEFRNMGLFVGGGYYGYVHLKYRIDHGNGYITQQTWTHGSHNPKSETITYK